MADRTVNGKLNCLQFSKFYHIQQALISS